MLSDDFHSGGVRNWRVNDKKVGFTSRIGIYKSALLDFSSMSFFVVNTRCYG